MQKHKLDEVLAHAFINEVGTNPAKFILGIMVLTAFLSMWMTNTATTTIMLPIAVFILASNKLKPLSSNFGKALILGIAFSATIGGIGTLIGSTPNAIVFDFLTEQGVPFDFLDWMYYGIPIVIFMIPIAWFVLIKMFKPEISKIKVEKRHLHLNPKQSLILLVFILTIALWLTTKIHGVSASLIAVVPIVSLYSLRLLDTKDFSKINWAALVLFGGGLSLGLAINSSGLGLSIANFLKSLLINQPLVLVFLILILFCIGLTLFASNTATAAIMVPVLIPLAVLLNIDIKILAVLAGIAVSLDFILPIGTPPSTIAYSSGYVHVKDMAKAGIVLSIIGTLLLTGLALLYW